MLNRNAHRPHGPAEGPDGGIDVLQRSFESFNAATLKLQGAFRSLEIKFESLNRELEEKNRRLERLLAEKEEVRSELETILESLTTGVIVTDLQGRITRMNGCAGRLTGMDPGAAGPRLAELLQGPQETGVTGESRPGRCRASAGSDSGRASSRSSRPP